MGNDPYRALVYFTFTRDIGFTVPGFPTPPPPFQEFQWGVGLRPLFDLSQLDLTNFATYLDLVKQVSQAMAAMPDTQRVDLGSPLLIGPETAADLSKDRGLEQRRPGQPGRARRPEPAVLGLEARQARVCRAVQGRAGAIVDRLSRFRNQAI